MSKAANARLSREYKEIIKNPPKGFLAHPSVDGNLLEWHYVVEGPEGTPYAGGQYWGLIIFNADYPFKPPSIRMHTPSGRFKPAARLCLSISEFHPKSFNPAWGVQTIILGLISFMTSEEITTGGVSATDAQRRTLAQCSRWWNSMVGSTTRNRDGADGDAGARFRKEFPELHDENMRWMDEHNIDLSTGRARGLPTPSNPPLAASDSDADVADNTVLTDAQAAAALADADAASSGSGSGSGSAAGTDAAAPAPRGPGGAPGQHNKLLWVGGAVFLYVLVVRLLAAFN